MKQYKIQNWSQTNSHSCVHLNDCRKWFYFFYLTQFHLLVIRQLEEEAKARDDGATMTTILCAAFAPLTLGLSMIGQLSANAQRAQADFCRKDQNFF